MHDEADAPNSSGMHPNEKASAGAEAIIKTDKPILTPDNQDPR